MEVFVVPVGREKYELYCESTAEAPQLEPGSTGIVKRIWHRFAVMLHAAEERHRGGAPPTTADGSPGNRSTPAAASGCNVGLHQSTIRKG